MRAQRAPENARLQQAPLGPRRVAVALKRSGQPLPGHQRVLHVGRDALHRRAERVALAGGTANRDSSRATRIRSYVGAGRSAMACPIPREAPVMSATGQEVAEKSYAKSTRMPL